MTAGPGPSGGPSKHSYQVLLVGCSDEGEKRFRNALVQQLYDLGIAPEQVGILRESAGLLRDRRLPTFVIYDGRNSRGRHSDLMADVIQDSLVVAPLVSSLKLVKDELPEYLRGVNALCINLESDDQARLVSLVLENFRLLRKERRLFISYKREDSQPLAEVLYDELDRRGFDVFIDVRSVPPAVDFQAELWHRMSDSDVIVLIDTPGFRDSRWTKAELAQANATNIQILHLLWPGQAEDASSSFSHFHQLESKDFDGGKPNKGEGISSEAVNRICSFAELLRARAIAARHRYLVDSFCDTARDLGLKPMVQPDRCILLPLSENKQLYVVPAIGVPTSNKINEIFEVAAAAINPLGELWMIYDNRGVLSSWLKHLDWLDSHLPVRAVRMSAAQKLLEEAKV